MKAQIKTILETRTVSGIEHKAIFPQHAKPGDSGADVYAFCPGVRIIIQPDQVVLVPTGVRMRIPDGTGLLILPRSSMGVKKLKVANSPGLLDSQYIGELKVALHNETNEDIYIAHGERVGQVVLVDVYELEAIEVDDLEATERGEGGFGHTGV